MFNLDLYFFICPYATVLRLIFQHRLLPCVDQLQGSSMGEHGRFSEMYGMRRGGQALEGQAKMLVLWT